jgi:hypothetical protein
MINHNRLDVRALELRHQQYMADFRYFADRLKKIYDAMPAPGFIITDGGRFEPLPPKKEWQEAIDHVICKWHEYARTAYPEFFPPENNEDGHSDS